MCRLPRPVIGIPIGGGSAVEIGFFPFPGQSTARPGIIVTVRF
jgi:hypothetical protein